MAQGIKAVKHVLLFKHILFILEGMHRRIGHDPREGLSGLFFFKSFINAVQHHVGVTSDPVPVRLKLDKSTCSVIYACIYL